MSKEDDWGDWVLVEVVDGELDIILIPTKYGFHSQAIYQFVRSLV